jgi:hypothetical protein
VKFLLDPHVLFTVFAEQIPCFTHRAFNARATEGNYLVPWDRVTEDGRVPHTEEIDKGFPSWVFGCVESEERRSLREGFWGGGSAAHSEGATPLVDVGWGKSYVGEHPIVAEGKLKGSVVAVYESARVKGGFQEFLCAGVWVGDRP